MADKYLQSDGVSGYLQSDGVSYYLISPVPASTFNPADKSGTLTLSYDNLVATAPTAGGGPSAVRSANSKSSGRYQVDFILWSIPTDGADGSTIGFGNATASLSAYVGNDANGIGITWADGRNVYNETVVTDASQGSPTFGSWPVTGAVGVRYSLIADFDTKQFWYAVNGTFRGNGSGTTQDPSTNAGGFTFTHSGPYFFMAAAARNGGVQVIPNPTTLYGGALAWEPTSGAVTVSPSAGHLAFTGYQPAITKITAITPSVGHLTFGGKVPSVTVGTSLNPAKGAIVFGGKQPSISLNIGISPSAGHLILGGKVPTVTRATAVSPSVGHIVLTGKTAVVVLAVNVAPSLGHLAFGGKVPTVSYTFRVSPSAGHIVFGGKVPTVLVSSGLTPSTGHVAYAGKVPLISTTLNPATGHIALAGHTPPLGLAIGSNTGHRAFTGYVPTVALNTAISPLLGHLTLGGYIPTVTFGVGALGHIKVNLGSFIAKPVKFWSGAAWVTKPLKRWTGTGWQETIY